MVSLNTRLSDETQTQVSEHHLWLSLFLCHSKFTRVQRLSCILTLLCLVMVSNAMFFRDSSENQNTDHVEFGNIRISFSTFYVSCIGILISTPPIIFASFVFRHIREKKLLGPQTRKSNDTNEKCKVQPSKIEIDSLLPKKDIFPHWVYYAAWVVLAVSTTTSCFFLVLYSMEWGKEKSEKWLFSFAFALVESLAVVDPIKVLFIVICSTVLKNIMEDDKPQVNLERLRSIAMTCYQYRERYISGEFVGFFFNKWVMP